MILMVGLIKPGVPSPSSVFWVFFFGRLQLRGKRNPIGQVGMKKVSFQSSLLFTIIKKYGRSRAVPQNSSLFTK